MTPTAADDRVGARVTGWWRLVELVYLALPIALAAGALLAVWGKQSGAILIVAAFSGLFIAHLAVAIAVYRRTMSREWPKVRPLEDDDAW